jgi:hypothetical protein
VAALRGYKPVVVKRVSKRTGKQYHYTQAYITPRGNRISRREYDTRRLLRETSFKNRGELERFRNTIAGSDWLSDIYEHTGRAPTFQDYDAWREVNRRRAALHALYPGHGGDRRGWLDALDPELVAADGPLARLLNAAGRREMRPGVAVGES